MAIYMYTDSAHTQMQILSVGHADNLTIPDSEWNNNIIPSRIVDGDNTYYISDYRTADLVWPWAQTISGGGELVPVIDLYTNDNYHMHFDAKPDSDPTRFTYTDTVKTYKPDGTVWKYGSTSVEPWNTGAIKKLVLKIVETNLVHGSDSIPVYGFLVVYVFTQGLTPRYAVVRNVFISRNLLANNAVDPTGGIPQQPEGGDGTFSAPSTPASAGTAASLSTAMSGGGLSSGSHGVHAYEISNAQMEEFCQKLYGAGSDTWGDLWQQFQNYQFDPLSGIIGALVVPCSPTGVSVAGINLSGQTIAVRGSPLAITQRFCDTSTVSINIDKYYDSFMDYPPETTATLYLPCIGSVNINIAECMRGRIDVMYRVDICTGNCVAFVDLYDYTGRVMQYTYSGNCGTPIPVAGNDRGISAIISGGMGIIGGAASILSSPFTGPASFGTGALGLASGAAQIAGRQQHEKHVGGFGGGCGCMGYLCPIVEITRPAVSTPEDYTARVGGMSNQSGAVGDYSGYTVFDWVDVSGISGATDAEKAEIENILKSGIFL